MPPSDLLSLRQFLRLPATGAVVLAISVAPAMHAALAIMALALTVLATTTVSLAAHAQNAVTEYLPHTLDWVAFDDLTAAQQDALPPGSCGAWIAPVREDAEARTNPAAAPVRVQADESRSFYSEEEANPAGKDTVGERLSLVGNVVITQGFRQLVTEKAELDRQSGLMTLEGALELREPNLLVIGDSATLNQQSGKGQVDAAHFVIHESAVRGAAGQLTKNADNTLDLIDSSFTSCEPGNNTWRLQGSRIRLDRQSRQGHAWNVRLEVKGIPVFYSPYLRFPLGDERMSGFLAPTFTFGESNTNVSVPYYFNLAPNYDLLFTPHYLERHGLLFEGYFRHLNRHFSSALNATFLDDDNGRLDRDDQRRVTNGEITAAQAAPFKGQDRWLVHLDQQGGEGEAWSTDINYSKVSDSNYFRDFDAVGIADEKDSFLDQKIVSRYQHRGWTFGLDAIRYQTLSATVDIPYEQLPALSANGDFNRHNWALSLDHEWITFDHPDAGIDTNPRLVGDRLRADYRLGLDYEPEWGFLRPAVQYKHRQYRLDSDNFASGADRSPSLGAPQFVMDTGLFFERDGNGYLQTFEPRLYYFFSDADDHSPLFDLTNDGQHVDFDTSELTFGYSQLFRDTRFSGGDRIDDANQLSIGISTRFFGNQSGREWFSASLGQITYFDDRKVTLDNTPGTSNKSDLALQLGSNPLAGLQITGDALFDTIGDRVTQWNLKTRYQTPDKHLLGLDYRFIRDNPEDTRELQLSFIAPLFSERWHLLVYSARDMERDRELDSIGAIEYNGCCFRLRAGYRRQLDNSLAGTISGSELGYDRSSFIEIHFEGLGGSSNRLDALFAENIDGFGEWQAVYHGD